MCHHREYARIEEREAEDLTVDDLLDEPDEPEEEPAVEPSPADD